jgi:hypothetical protein
MSNRDINKNHSIQNLEEEEDDDDFYNDQKKLLSTNYITQEIEIKQPDVIINQQQIRNGDEFDKLINNVSIDSINLPNNNNEVIINLENKSKSKLIYFVDALISALIFGPISGFYW